MRDFKNYTPEGGGEDISSLAEKINSRYKGKSERDVIGSIIEQAKAGKKNGTLTNADIDAFYERLSPMLDAAKRKKLKEITELIKNS